MAQAIQVTALHPETRKVLGIWKDFKFLQIRREINKPGYYQMILDHTDKNFNNLELDSLMKFERSPFGGRTYTEFWGLHRTVVKSQFSTGLGQYSSFGRGLLDLLNRRIIANYADIEIASSGTPNCGGLATAQRVDRALLRYVQQHAASLATTGNGRLSNGVTHRLQAGYHVISNPDMGALYTGENAWRNLLQVIQELSEFSHARSIVGDGDPYEFYMTTDNEDDLWFLLSQGGIGRDKTESNDDGAKPVIFSRGMGNTEDLWVSYTRSEEINRVFALGDGDGAGRNVTITSASNKIPTSFGGTDASDTSVYNLIEASRNATGETSSAALNSFGAAELYKNKAEPSATFIPYQMEPFRYGRDYSIGDKITIKHEEFSVDLRIKAVELLIDGSGNETVKLEFFEKPNQLSAEYLSINPDETVDNNEGNIELIYRLLQDIDRAQQREVAH